MVQLIRFRGLLVFCHFVSFRIYHFEPFFLVLSFLSSTVFLKVLFFDIVLFVLGVSCISQFELGYLNMLILSACLLILIGNLLLYIFYSFFLSAGAK